ncbi:regucalcin-like [Periplaneta americana]|uniref:regucalcin-like n=1 Tax=Periplaneta americana TaxID=6978 RepID=UPI0037E7A688
MSPPEVTKIVGPALLGEGPHWDHDSQALYYVDLPGSTINKYVPATKKHTTVNIAGGHVSLVIPLEGTKDKFVIATGSSIAIMTWNGESSTPADVKYVYSVNTEKDAHNTRFNDGKADPTGRFWAGTLPSDIGSLSEPIPEVGTLYSFSNDWNATPQLSKIRISNGMAWTEDRKIMYYIDSMTKKIYSFDVDVKSGHISNKRTAFDYETNGVEGYPDGMAIDTEGKLWVACYNGSKVIRVDPTTGKLLSQIAIPALQVTSVTFGGSQLDELYVTTGNLNLSEEEQKMYPLSGFIFRVTGVGVKGYPGQAVKL